MRRCMDEQILSYSDLENGISDRHSVHNFYRFKEAGSDALGANTLKDYAWCFCRKYAVFF